VAWDRASTREEFVKLIIGDTLVSLIRLKAIEGEVVERCMLIGTWVVSAISTPTPLALPSR